jgi:AcrR family transcriptional regulator
MEIKSSDSKVIGHFFNQKLEPASLKEKFIFAMFQVVADKGADALTASILVRMTRSSKGALFHHFKTLDDLCLSCLVYFKSFVKDSIQVGQPKNLLDFLLAFAHDESRRKFNSAYFHLTHFFHDRAIRDSQFQTVLRESADIYANQSTDLVMMHLEGHFDREQVKSTMMLFSFGLERIYFHGLVSSNAQQTQRMIQSLVESTHAQLQKH